jgi:dimethylargininase
MFTRAIVRPPAPNFSEGLTTSGLGPPSFERAVEQHAAYCAALEQCGLTVTRLEPDPNYPDSTFVEDTAILTERCAVIARPGAQSRRGEVMNMRGVVADFYSAAPSLTVPPQPGCPAGDPGVALLPRSLLSIEAPATLDGGDVCQAANHFFIGLSERTNQGGAQQLAELLSPFGYSSSRVDIRKIDGLLHLKSGLAYLGDNRLVVTEGLDGALTQELPESQTNSLLYAPYEIVRVNAEEQYAANCVRVNQCVLIAAGYESFARRLSELGYQTIALDMSEFQKMDGGLSCLSLRF